MSTAAGQQFTSSPQQLTVMQGSNVTLPCHLTNLGKPSPCPRLPSLPSREQPTGQSLPSAALPPVTGTAHWTVTALGFPPSRPGNNPLDSHTLHSTALPPVPETTHWTVTHCTPLPFLPSRKQPTGQSHAALCCRFRLVVLAVHVKNVDCTERHVNKITMKYHSKIS